MRRLACVVGLLAVGACEEIVARPLSSAPRNTCSEHPCAAYDTTTPAAECRGNQCELPVVGNLPDYPFWVVVNLPDTSFFAPGLSYVFAADAKGEPSFRTPLQANSGCAPPQCLQVGKQAFQYGQYLASFPATERVRQGLDPVTRAPIEVLTAEQAIPVRVIFTSTGNGHGSLASLDLPLQPLVATSGANDDGRVASNGFGRVLLAGTYTRELYPQAPFDAIYPPVTSEIAFTNEGSALGNFELVVPAAGSNEVPPQALDGSAQCSVASSGDVRCAVVTREEGLDGWRVWLENPATGKRVSVIHTFSNTVENGVPSVVTRAATLLYTATGGGDLQGLNAIVAPPEGSVGVPRLRDPLIGGVGLGNLNVPTVPLPVTVRGVVAEPDGPVLLGYPAKVSLVSTGLRPNPNLEYRTTVNTDDRGRFATVLPPGDYEATVEPAIGTRFAVARIAVAVDREPTALTLRPPPRTNVRGRALLSDERPAAEAAVVFEPRATTDGAPAGRPGRAEVAADGTYAIDLDPGAYVMSVIPKAGTGFARVVKRVVVGPDTEPVSVPDVRIPPPIHMSFNLRDPNANGNAISRAVVRVFASFPGEVAPVEIGSTFTDSEGLVEILLAPRPE